MPFPSKSQSFSQQPKFSAGFTAQTPKAPAAPKPPKAPKQHPAVKQGLESFMAAHGASFHRNAGRGFKPKK